MSVPALSHNVLFPEQRYTFMDTAKSLAACAFPPSYPYHRAAMDRQGQQREEKCSLPYPATRLLMRDLIEQWAALP